MTICIEESLFLEVKEYLKITWEDEDNNIKKSIDRAKCFLSNLSGTEIDFVNNKQANNLLLNYCRYDYNNSSEYFEDNFSKEILRFQIQEGVKSNVI